MNIKKTLVGAVAGVAVFGSLALSAFAAAPNWNVTGSWNINVEYLSINYPETLNLTQAGGNITGGNLNTVPPTAASAFTVTGGTVSGDTIDIFATHDTSTLVVHLTGTTAPDGSMGGTWADVSPGTRTGTWSSTSGNAIELIGPPTNKDQCRDNGWKVFNNPTFKNQGDCISYVAKNTLVGKATGDIWMGGDGVHQQIDFNAFDYGSNSSQDKGQVEYWNYDYPGPLHYTANVMCSTVSGNETRFMFQIPAGWPGLTGLYVVSYVKDNGTPGTNGDLYGHNATSSLTTAKQWCETGSGLSPAMYPITAGNLVVH